MATSSLWQRFQRYFLEDRELGFSLDISRMKRNDPARQRPCTRCSQHDDGVLNFFVTFVEVRNDRRGAWFEVEDGIARGDYLQRFLRGTRSALYEKGRESITMSIPEVNAFYIGALIALSVCTRKSAIIEPL
jgi:hypothetical protein